MKKVQDFIKYLELEDVHKSSLGNSVVGFNKKQLQEIATYLGIPIRRGQLEGRLDLKKQGELIKEINEHLMERLKNTIPITKKINN